MWRWDGRPCVAPQTTRRYVYGGSILEFMLSWTLRIRFPKLSLPSQPLSTLALAVDHEVLGTSIWSVGPSWDYSQATQGLKGRDLWWQQRLHLPELP
jgi:hypothetical protein